MRDLSSYTFTKLWEDGEFILSRATPADGASVLVQASALPRSSPAAMARLQRAVAFRDELDSSWAARPLEVVAHDGGLALISEDPGQELLAHEVGRPWAIDDFLRVAAGLAAALRRLHARGLVHKDIKPANVLIDMARGDAWLTGFGFASRLARERLAPEPPHVIAGTLAYMAPEQTGRMNRSVDSRSDLYALGVTFYELKEVHHRVKNNLQLISSLLNLQASRVTDPVASELFAESRNRVRSIALVHENLYRAGNFAQIDMAAHVGTLCAHLSRAYGLAAQSIELIARVGELHLEMDRAMTCGLIINELVSNALEHAFPHGQPGRVWVELRNGDEGSNILVVRDDGVGLGVDFDVGRADSLGLRLVFDLIEQLKGTLTIGSGPGTTFTITFRDRPAARASRWNAHES